MSKYIFVVGRTNDNGILKCLQEGVKSGYAIMTIELFQEIYPEDGTTLFVNALTECELKLFDLETDNK